MAKNTKGGIENKVMDCPVVPWREVKKYEANRLKASERRNVEKLKKAILSEGFSFPMIVWQPGNGVDPNYVIDGAGRIAALHQLDKEGFTIPDLPIVFVLAESREQAKKLVTLASSQFGVVDADSFGDFVKDIGGVDVIAAQADISSTIFATSYTGPVVPKDGDEPKKSRNQREKLPKLPAFEPGDIIEFGPHQIMAGYEEDKKPILEKILNFIRKEWPELELTKNGEALV